jgi:hypothetical protein
MDFANTNTTICMLDNNESSTPNTFILTWRFEPVIYDTLLSMIKPKSPIGSLLSLDQFTYKGEQMTRRLLRQILGWRENLHPAAKIEFELTSDTIFSLRKMRVLAVSRLLYDESSYEHSTGIISIDVSQSDCLTRLELHFPLSN